MSNLTAPTIAQREANTELFLEDNAEFLLDPSELWCRPAIAFAKWDAKDTEGLRGDGERDIARNFAIKQILLDQTLKTFSMPSIDMHYLADLIVSHFEEVYSGESAEAFTNDPEITDGEEIPFDAPAPQQPDFELFQQVDDLLRSHFGLPSKPRF